MVIYGWSGILTYHIDYQRAEDMTGTILVVYWKVVSHGSIVQWKMEFLKYRQWLDIMIRIRSENSKSQFFFYHHHCRYYYHHHHHHRHHHHNFFLRSTVHRWWNIIKLLRYILTLRVLTTLRAPYQKEPKRTERECVFNPL